MTSNSPAAGSKTARTMGPASTRTGARVPGGRVVRGFAVLIALLAGFGLAGFVGTANADEYAGDTAFHTEVECHTEGLTFITNSDAEWGSYAKLWVWDSYTEEWITDDYWVEADAYALYEVPDLALEPGLYFTYVEYAQWNGYDWDVSGEFIEEYTQFTGDVGEVAPYCFVGI